jgi:hypothetical protein
MLWTANTTYGEKLVGWQVTKVSIAPTCQKWGTKAYPWQPSFKVRGNTHEDRLHNEYGYKSTIIVELTATVNTKNTRRHSKDITFYDLYNTSRYSRWYKEKPVTVEDMLGE